MKKELLTTTALNLTNFKKFDLLPFSFSKASRWLNDPVSFYISYIEKIKLASAAMLRGTCVEHGVFCLFEGKGMKQAVKECTELFDEGVKDLDDPRIDYERENLEMFVQGFWTQLQDYTMTDYQEEQNFEVLGVPIIGYTDFGIKLNDSELKVDLKTSKRMPKKLTHSIQLQQSLYAKSSNMITKVLYSVVNRTQSNAQWFDVTEQDTSEKIFRDILISMDSFLSKCEDKHEMKKMLVPNLDNWIWDYDPRMSEIRKQIWGY